MEQFIGLIIFLVAWAIISSLKKAAKKQQSALDQLKKGSQQNQTASNPASTADEITKLIEMFTGSQPAAPQYTPAPVDEYTENYSDNMESIESSVEEGGREAVAPEYHSIDSYVPCSSSLEDFSTEENLYSVLTQPAGTQNVVNQEKNQSNPVLSDFDLRKAVIYSAILEPKYF